MASPTWLDDLGALLGPAGLLRPDQGLTPAEREPYELDWRRRYRGQALAIARLRHRCVGIHAVAALLFLPPQPALRIHPQ